MAVDPVTSALTADLERLYTQAERRLALIVRAGLNRGLDPARLGTDRQRRGDSTLAYRERQRQQAEAILANLRARTTGATPGVVAGAYNAGVVTVDRTVGNDLRLRGEFGRVHVAAVEQLAGNLERSLHAAADKVGEHIATVFERAQAVEGALREGHNPATHVGVRFIGRRVDDAYRTATLEELAKATIGLDTRRQASAMLARRLVTDGLSDGLTALVDAGGRRWGLGEYAEMAARTTTAEAVSQGTLGRLEEGGLDLVAITSHPHQADVCTPFDGKTFSRSGTDPRYPPLTSTPPFHPRCRHRLAPAATNLDDYEARLAQAAREQQPTPAAPVEVAPPAELPPPAPPPVTLPLEDALNVVPLARRAVDPIIERIGRVHRVPDFARERTRFGQGLTVRSNPLRPGVAGEYRYRTNGEPDDLIVDPSDRSDKELRETVTHEIGHFVDHQALHPDPGFASDDDPDLEELRAALDASQAVRELRARLERGTAPQRQADGSSVQAPMTDRTRAIYEYLLDRRELFARAYAQWIALRTDDVEVRALLIDARLAGARISWQTADFEPIAEALDATFRKKGLLK